VNNHRFRTFLVSGLLILAAAGRAGAAPSLCNGAPNGILDGDEQCESGPCCTAKCELASESTVCRTSTDAVCDPAETCGTQAPAAVAACPADAAAPNGTTCNDGLFCTVGETCTGGECGGGQANPCSDDNSCTADSCSENNNTCKHDKAADGASCNDGSACTVGDTCSNGFCTSGESRVCADTNACTDDSCDPDTGDCVFANNTDPCEDGLFCTAGDACSGGACVGGAASGCDDGEGCTIDSCNEETNSCTHQTAPDGTSCEDDFFCTTGDTCTGGVCTSGPPSSCNDDNDCTKDACDEDTNECSHSATNNQGPCFDGSLCTTDDTCHNGVCEGGPAKFCIDGNPCTDDSCDETTGDCAFTNIGGPCSDGLFCTTGDTCTAGVCVPSGVSCDDGNPCTIDSCDEGLDTCSNVNSNDPCDDGFFCTDGDTCSGGSCVPGPARNCGDGNACTDDTCNDTTDACEHQNNTAPCSDGLGCTTGDVCSGGECTGAPKDCGDGNICTTDSCSEPTGLCSNVNNTAACDDGEFCTFPDACAAGACVPGPLRNCDDTNQCTIDSCNEGSNACDHAPTTGECDDGLFCTENDACSGGVCTGTLRNCADENGCTTDACNDITNECDHLDNTAPCDDGVFCNGSDSCAGGSCSVHPGDPCDGPDDDSDCTETCNEQAAACSASDPDQSACSDGNSCTVGDQCVAGVCVSGASEGEGCVPTTTTTTLEATTTTTIPGATTTTLEPATTTTLAPATTTTVEGATTTTLAGATTTTVAPETTTTLEAATTTTIAVVTTTTLVSGTTTTTLESPLCGDFTGDGELTATDALGVLRAATDLEECDLSVCDFTGDSNITAIDALAVLRASVDLPSDPNCPAAAVASALASTGARRV